MNDFSFVFSTLRTLRVLLNNEISVICEVGVDDSTTTSFASIDELLYLVVVSKILLVILKSKFTIFNCHFVLLQRV